MGYEIRSDKKCKGFCRVCEKKAIRNNTEEDGGVSTKAVQVYGYRQDVFICTPCIIKLSLEML